MKIKPSDLKAEAQKLLAANKMPDLDTLLTAVAATRKKFKPQIEEARKSNSKGESDANEE